MNSKNDTTTETNTNQDAPQRLQTYDDERKRARKERRDWAAMKRAKDEYMADAYRAWKYPNTPEAEAWRQDRLELPSLPPPDHIPQEFTALSKRRIENMLWRSKESNHVPD